MELPTSSKPDEAIDQQALASLKAIGGDDPTFVNEIIALFLDQAPRNLEAVRKALESADLRALAEAAHHTKSSSFYLGARRLSQLCAQAELAAREHGDLEALGRLLRAMLLEFEMVRQGLSGRG
jgi:HPt (histidine-containing phosphotransfer) domain-containing protein